MRRATEPETGTDIRNYTRVLSVAVDMLALPPSPAFVNAFSVPVIYICLDPIMSSTFDSLIRQGPKPNHDVFDSTRVVLWEGIHECFSHRNDFVVGILDTTTAPDEHIIHRRLASML